MSVNEKMTAIADAIRDKTGGTEKLGLDGMAAGIDEVYEAGKKAEHDAFWDVFQDHGNRTNYNYAFAYEHWSSENFKPKYDIKPVEATNMFYCSTLTGDLDKILTAAGVELDFSNATGIRCLFQYASLEEVGILDFSNTAYATNAVSNVFSNSSVKTIKKLIVSETTWLEYAFTNATALENLTIEGPIALNINVGSCALLTHDSLMSIINALTDYSEDARGITWKVILGSTNIAKLTEDELAQIEAKGWTYA